MVCRLGDGRRDVVADHVSKNRDRLLESDIASAFFDAVLAQARAAGLLSDEHFTVDGTLLEAWASLKSFRRKDERPQPPLDDLGNPTVNFHGESRKNDTHQSTSDPDAGWIQTTERYLGCKQKLRGAVNDRLGIEPDTA